MLFKCRICGFVIATFAVIIIIITEAESQSLPQKKVLPFELNQVTLLPGSFRNAMERRCRYLLFLDNDRLLYSFRANYKLPTQGALQYGGWESMAIRGHTTGHVLSALAQAYQSTGDEQYKKKAESLVVELQKCQNAAVSAGFGDGYLAAIPESDVNTLLNLGNIWAPLYNIHKTFAGLLDCYRLLGNKTALDMAKKLGDWTYNKLSPYNHEKFQQFWNNRQSAAGEFGGYNESLAELYRITGDNKYLTAAYFFDHDRLFNPCLAMKDELNGLHANTSIPEIIGALKIYETSGHENSYTIAKNFFDIVIGAHTYINGGNSENEYFKAPNAIASQLTDKTCETCNVYNMLKLTRQLFFFDPLTKYMDYYERALYNQILASQDPSSAHGHCTYFQPLRPGGIKTYGSDESFMCCDGTGLENHTKYGETIYAHAGDTLYVNLFIPSQLNWPEKNVTVRMETKYPDNDTVKLTLSGAGAANLPIKFRAPSWLRKSMEVWVEGSLQAVVNARGSYFTFLPQWNTRGTITVVLPQTLRFEKTPDDPSVGGVMYGIQLLAAGYGTNNLSSMPTLNAANIVKTKDDTLKFTATPSSGAVTMIPFCRMHGQRYTVYWKLTNVPPDTFLQTSTYGSGYRLGEKTEPSSVTIGHNSIIVTFTESTRTEDPVSIRIFDVHGALVKKIEQVASQGTNGINIPLGKNEALLRGLKRKVKQALVSTDQYEYYSRWYNIVIRELACIIDWNEDYDLLARSVIPAIKKAEARESVEFLLKTGFLKKENGKYIQSDPAITSGPEVCSLGIRNYNHFMAERARKALDEFPPAERDIQSVTVGISSESFRLIKQEMQEFISRVVRIVDDDKKAERVYNINVHLFPMSVSHTDGGGGG